ncbi:MAG: tetratricopeptide repeat protein [Gammaproteobacteria bacterium]
METNVTEQQQLETIKKWWQANGSSIITGVILGIAVLFGTKAWFAWRENIAQQASDIYTSMIATLEQGDRMATTERAGILISDYSGSPYAALAALAIARLRIEEGELEAAQTQLQWVVDNADVDYTRLIARLRLARVMLALQDVDGAEAVLLAAGPEADTEVMFVELKGDIHSARGHQELAATAYSKALSIAAADYPGSHLLQLKFDNARALGGDGTEAGQ